MAFKIYIYFKIVLYNKLVFYHKTLATCNSVYMFLNAFVIDYGHLCCQPCRNVACELIIVFELLNTKEQFKVLQEKDESCEEPER